MKGSQRKNITKTKRKSKERKKKNTLKIKDKKYAPPTLPNAIANKLWLVLNIHPHPESDIQPIVPPCPCRRCWGTAATSFCSRWRWRWRRGCLGCVLAGYWEWGEEGGAGGEDDERGKREEGRGKRKG
jgi:hypothetical protein